jgi:hypothetical protein
MTKIGKGLIGLLLLFLTPLTFPPVALAGVQASVDRQEVPLDESVSLKITRTGDSDRPFQPKFDAPDFEIMNQFQNSQFSSVYVNGKFENRSEESVTFILRPLKVGALKIRNISSAGEKTSDLTIQVIQEQLQRKPLPGDAPTLRGDAKNFFVKGEVSASRVYKGQQIVVSFYLYRRTRAQVRDVMQYPAFQGFIREDLEMPILSGRPDFEAVNMGGIPLERALLARYAVYPIKEGKLKIDGFSVRVDYVPKNPASDDLLEDPVFQFFTQVTPRSGSSKSDPLLIEVLPLPEEGRTPLFTGGVGDFEITTSLDAPRIRAHEPFTFRIGVKGKGNTSLVEFPKVDWPKGLRLYESQGKSKSLGQGLSEKVFEVVMIPELAGAQEIPPIEFEFFNPESRSYIRKKTAAMPIQVEAGNPASAPATTSRDPGDRVSGGSPSGGASPNGTPAYGDLRERDKQLEGGFLGQPWWRLVSWVGLLMFFCFIGLVGWDHFKKRSMARLELLKKKQGTEQLWKGLEQGAAEARDPSELGRILDQLTDEIYKSLDQAYGLSSRALPKRELARILTEHHAFPPEDWRTISALFELEEQVRFSAGAIGDLASTGERVKSSVESLRRICVELSRKSMERQA